MKTFIKKFVKDDSGAAIVEYGLALLVVGALGVGAFQALGSQTATNVAGACTAIGTSCEPGGGGGTE